MKRLVRQHLVLPNQEAQRLRLVLPEGEVGRRLPGQLHSDHAMIFQPAFA